MSIPEKNENKGSRAVARDRRRVDVAQDLANGFTVRESAESQGVSKDTIVKDRKAIAGRHLAEADETIQEYRAAQLIELTELKALLVSPGLSLAKKVELSLAIIDREIDLTGTKAPTKSISARFSATEDPLYLEFKRATMGLDEAEVRQALGQLAQIPRTQAKPNEDWFPKNNKETEG